MMLVAALDRTIDSLPSFTDEDLTSAIGMRSCRKYAYIAAASLHALCERVRQSLILPSRGSKGRRAEAP